MKTWLGCLAFGARRCPCVGAGTGLKALVAVAMLAGEGGGGDQLPGKRPLRDRARDKCSHRPLFRGIISTLLICCSIHIHTRLPWMEREREAEIGGTAEVEGQDGETGREVEKAQWKPVSQTNRHLRRERNERVNTATALHSPPFPFSILPRSLWTP